MGPIFWCSPESRPRRACAGRPGLYHFAILVPSRARPSDALRRLVDTRYRSCRARPITASSEALYLCGSRTASGIEIYRDRPREQWPFVGLPDLGKACAWAPIRSTSTASSRSRTARRRHGLAPVTVIGHVHLHVSHLDAAERFYVGVLGFDLMQRYGPSALFVSAGGYHHHIGLNTWAGVGAPPPPAGAIGLRMLRRRASRRGGAWQTLPAPRCRRGIRANAMTAHCAHMIRRATSVKFYAPGSRLLS